MDKYFVVREEDKKAVRGLFGISEKEVLQKVNLIKTWIEQRPHLPPESKDDTFINLMLLRAKFKEDVARKNIENYFKYLCKYPEIFSGLGHLKPLEEVGIAVLCLQPTEMWERVAVLKLSPEKISGGCDVNIARCIAMGIATAMISFNKDYIASVRLILDFDCFTMSHILQVNINDLFKLINIYENVLKMRISGIELVNAPHLIGVLLSIAKVVLKPKLFSRVTSHKDLNSLYKNVSRKFLPSDYGGEQKSIKDLIKTSDEIFANHKTFFGRLDDLVNANKTDTKKEIFGVQGSFKTFVID